MAPSPHLLEKLCTVLLAEAERQEAVRAAAEAQAEALRSRDLGVLERATTDMRRLVAEAVAAEPERLAVLRALVDELDLPVEAQTMTGLIAALDAPWDARLRTLQLRLREALSGAREAVRRSRPMLQRSMRFNEGAIATVWPVTMPAANTYTAEGARRTSQGEALQPALLNQRG